MGKIASLVNVLPRRDFHDLSQSIYGTLTWGLLYPVYSRYFNAGDIVKIKPNFVLRTAPTVAPLFSPVEVRLHRFWCPLRLYHNSMRENSRRFDYTTLAHHVIASYDDATPAGVTYKNSVGTLADWLNYSVAGTTVASSAGSTVRQWLRYAAEPLIAYWDIVRNYYGFTKLNMFSYMSAYGDEAHSMTQEFSTLDVLDAWVESIYNERGPVSISSRSLTLSGYKPISFWSPEYDPLISSQKNLEMLAVCPSNPDGLSRVVPNVASDVVTVNSPITIPSLAVAAKAQSVKDILSAAGTRFTDYLYAFFKTSIPHSDIPSLLYSGKFWLNSSPVFQSSSGSSAGVGGGQLGSFVGSNVGSAGLSSRRYKFDEPGYLMDILSIRPVYAWSGCVPYYNIDVDGAYMFNPRFNQLGWRSIDQREYGFIASSGAGGEVNTATDYKTPFWNEFRSSIDMVHGRMRWVPGVDSVQNTEAYFVLQRTHWPYLDADGSSSLGVYSFCDMDNINNYFVSTSFAVDNTYMSSYYDVSVSSYVSKRFATDLTA